MSLRAGNVRVAIISATHKADETPRQLQAAEHENINEENPIFSALPNNIVGCSRMAHQAKYHSAERKKRNTKQQTHTGEVRSEINYTVKLCVESSHRLAPEHMLRSI